MAGFPRDSSTPIDAPIDHSRPCLTLRSQQELPAAQGFTRNDTGDEAMESPRHPAQPPRLASAFRSWARIRRAGVAALLLLGCQGASLADESWHDGYELYQPKVTTATVFAGPSHDASIVFFDGKWLAMWDSGTEAYGQVIWQSNSADLVTWSEPIESFSSSAASMNPVTVTPTTKWWQPSLLVVGDQLWCLWNTSGTGTYFSTRNTGSQKWTNTKLTFPGGGHHAFIDGKPWTIFVGNAGIRSSSGTVLFPITLIRAGTQQDFWATEKRDSVLYTDDAGVHWKVAPGLSYGADATHSWEATIWEPQAGTLNLISRNNRKPSRADPLLNPLENLKFTQTPLDRLDAWLPPAPLPLETAMSRPHVVHRGARNFLVQNDSHVSLLPDRSMLVNRKNLTVFFNRGTNADFVAGLNLDPAVDFAHKYPVTDYPQMSVHGETGVVIFTEKPQAPPFTWKTRVASIDPLPGDTQYYLFPRQARGSVAQIEVDGRSALRFSDDYSSAGVDLPPNDPLADRLTLSFDFAPESVHRQSIVTFGHPSTLVFVQDGRLGLTVPTENQHVDCGPVSGWTHVELSSQTTLTQLRVNHHSRPACSLAFGPSAARAMYFGVQHYAGKAPSPGAAFLIDLRSVKTRVSPARKGEQPGPSGRDRTAG